MVSFHDVVQNKARPSNVAGVRAEDLVHDDSILGNVSILFYISSLETFKYGGDYLHRSYCASLLFLC